MHIFQIFADKETMAVVDDDHLTFDGSMMVTKFGRTTGATVGVLKHKILTVRVDESFLSRGYFAFFNCYSIENANTENFFSEGDSGAGVFLIENKKSLRPLGIAFAHMNSQTAVCQINQILNKLDLTIVKYFENSKVQALYSRIMKEVPEDQNSESMDCS